MSDMTTPETERLMPELASCPFCGSKARLLYLGEIGRYDDARVDCTECPASMEVEDNIEGFDNVMAAMTEAWNRRTPAPTTICNRLSDTDEAMVDVCARALAEHCHVPEAWEEWIGEARAAIACLTPLIRAQRDKEIGEVCQLLADVELTMNHARFFITHREKMYETGVGLYDETHAAVSNLLNELGKEPIASGQVPPLTQGSEI